MLNTTAKTYKKIFAEYASNNSKMNKDIKKNADDFIDLLNGKKILDVGCANGRESKYFFDKGFDVAGCDISQDFIDLAKVNCPNCDFFISDMRSIKSKEVYDGLWVSASFLHIPKKESLKTLKGFYNLLNKKGILYISVMEGNFDGLRENKTMNWPARHFSDYSEDEISLKLQEAGFKLIKISHVKTNWGPTFLHILSNKN